MLHFIAFFKRKNIPSIGAVTILAQNCIVFALLLIMALTISTVSKGQSSYDFEKISIYQSLHGKDNWKDKIGQGNAAVYMDATLENGTHIVRPMSSVIFNQPAFITRENDSNYNFQQFSGNETNAVVQFDVTGDYIAIFALGFDWNKDGVLDTAHGEIGPAFGTWDQHFTIVTANTDSIIAMQFGSGNGRSDWYRIQLHINFTTNNGLGSGSLYYRNLTDGDVNFIPIAGLQNINLQLKNMNQNAQPNTWNTMWLQLLADGGNEPAIDNLVPSLKTSTGAHNSNLSLTKSYIEQNFPNPFRSSTSIKYFLPNKSKVTISVFDFCGNKILTLVDEVKSPGAQEVTLDGTNITKGIYYYQIETDQFFYSKKMIRIE